MRQSLRVNLPRSSSACPPCPGEAGGVLVGPARIRTWDRRITSRPPPSRPDSARLEKWRAYAESELPAGTVSRRISVWSCCHLLPPSPARIDVRSGQVLREYRPPLPGRRKLQTPARKTAGASASATGKGAVARVTAPRAG